MKFTETREERLEELKDLLHFYGKQREFWLALSENKKTWSDKEEARIMLESYVMKIEKVNIKIDILNLA